jgi:hypothetical protein
MLTGATGQYREPGFNLPAGVYGRQVWRPLGLRGVELILSGIARRNEPLDRRRARLTAWHEQFARRSQPFIGWMPLTTGQFGVDDIPSSPRSDQSEDRMARRERQMISKEPPSDTHIVRGAGPDQPPATHSHRFPGEPQTPPGRFLSRQFISDVRSPPSSESRPSRGPFKSPETPIEAVVQPVAPPEREATSRDSIVMPPSSVGRQLGTKDGRPATEDWGRALLTTAPRQPYGEQSFARPAIRLAILRPISTAVAAIRPNESGAISSDTSSFSAVRPETKDFPGLENLPTKEQSAFRPRLVSSVSSFPRQEVRGGFPLSLKPAAHRDTNISSDDLIGVSVRDTLAFENYVSTETASSAGLYSSPSLSIGQVETPESPAAIQRLINRTALPGLQIRLVKPDDSASATQRSANAATEGGRSTIGVPKADVPLPATPPPLDINAVVDKVLHALRRRHQLERERRGLY